MRNPDCKDYDQCLTAAAKTGRKMECNGCPRFAPSASALEDEEFRAAPRADRVEEREDVDTMAEGSSVKNRLVDLNDHLFEQMERLNDDELKGDDLGKEIIRAKAMSLLASQIIGNARLALDAATAKGTGKIKDTPAMLGMGAGK